MTDVTINSSPSSAGNGRTRMILHGFLVGILLLALLGGHAWWLHTYYAQVAAGPTAAGHLLPAKQLAAEGRPWIQPASPAQYMGDHFVKTADGGSYVSTLPPGFAWIAAPVYRFGGQRAAMYLNPILASVTVLFLFLLCRRWTGGWFALLAAMVYAANPTANLQAVHADAHTAGTAFLVIGLFFLDGWARRPGPMKALLAGLAFGLAPTIRPAEVVCGIGVALMILAKVWQEGPRWRQLFLLLLGALIPLGAFLIQHHMAFGTWLPGRDPAASTSQLGWTGVGANAISYLEDLSGRGAGVLLGLGLAGMVAMVCQRDTRILGIGLLGILIPVAAVPMLGEFTWDSLQRFLPIFSLLTLGAFWLLRQLALTNPRVGWPAALAVTALTIALSLPVASDSMAPVSRSHELAATVVKGADRILDKDSLIVCGPRLADPLAQAGWNVVDQNLVTASAGHPAPEGRATEAAAPRREGDKLAGGYREAYHRLSGGELARQVDADLLRWADGHRIYWVGRSEEYEIFRKAAETRGQLTKLAEIEMPAPKAENGGWSRHHRDRPAGARPAWQVPDDGQPMLVYEWVLGKAAPEARTETGAGAESRRDEDKKDK